MHVIFYCYPVFFYLLLLLYSYNSMNFELSIDYFQAIQVTLSLQVIIMGSFPKVTPQIRLHETVEPSTSTDMFNRFCLYSVLACCAHFSCIALIFSLSSWQSRTQVACVDFHSPLLHLFALLAAGVPRLCPSLSGAPGFRDYLQRAGGFPHSQ